MISLGAVEPGRCGRIIDPGMVRTGVVNDFVLNDLNARAMRGVDQLAQLCERAKVFFNGIKVVGVVAVKCSAWFSVFELNFIQTIVIVIPRREPDGGDAEFL